ncbi:MAG: hypothetical protein H6551_07520 [Chitinophagales bacterium]|nr:hypothetical protein [Chitinophagaceae bacterium]MCB9064978.1 hypothetical protein [Chitinophagales bacterium]
MTTINLKKSKAGLFYLLIISISVLMTVSIWFWYAGKIDGIENEVKTNQQSNLR